MEKITQSQILRWAIAHLMYCKRLDEEELTLAEKYNAKAMAEGLRKDITRIEKQLDCVRLLHRIETGEEPGPT